MWFISFRDLRARQRRFAIAIAGTALVFALGLIGSGMSSSFRGEIARTLDAIGADAWVIPQDSGGPFSSFGVLPGSNREQVATTDGVKRADPLIVVRRALPLEDGPLDVTVFGFTSGGLGEPDVAEGRLPRSAGEVVIDSSSGVEIGDRVGPATVVGRTNGLTLNAGAPNLYVRLADARAVALGGEDLVTAFVTRGMPSEPIAGMTTMTDAEARADLMRPFERAISAIDLLRFLLWLVAGSIIGAIVYLTTLERLRDFAVLRAVGSTPRALFMGLASQSIVVSLGAAILSIGVASALAPTFPMPIEIPMSAYMLMPVIAIVVGLAASASGLRRALTVDPAMAFGGHS